MHSYFAPYQNVISENILAFDLGLIFCSFLTPASMLSSNYECHFTVTLSQLQGCYLPKPANSPVMYEIGLIILIIYYPTTTVSHDGNKRYLNSTNITHFTSTTTCGSMGRMGSTFPYFQILSLNVAEHIPPSPFPIGSTERCKDNCVTENINNNINSVVLSASELYQPSDRRLSAKLMQILRIEGVAWSARRIPTAVISIF
jgi:hypothetical protein